MSDGETYDGVDQYRHYHRYCCYVCWRNERLHRRAVIRAFSGQFAGEGFPACEAHQRIAITEAMEPLVKFHSSINYAQWFVRVNRVVVDEHGYPNMKRIFTAWRRT